MDEKSNKALMTVCRTQSELGSDSQTQNDSLRTKSSESLSIFRNEPPIKENELAVLLTQLSCNFTDNDKYFFTMLAKKIRDKGMSYKQLAFAVDYLLVHHRFKLKIADVFSVDECLKTYKKEEFEQATETYPHPKFGYVYVGKYRYIVNADEAEKYRYEVTPITTDAELRHEKAMREKEEKKESISLLEYLEKFHKENPGATSCLEKGVKDEDVREYLEKFHMEHEGERSYFDNYVC